MSQREIGVVGGGNMARAIIEGCLASGRFGPEQWVVAEPEKARRGPFDAVDVETVEHAGALAARLSPEAQVILAVKPQSLGQATADLGGGAAGRVVITMLAGTPSRKVRDALGGDDAGVRVVRVMPNMPAQIGRGTTAMALGAGAREGDDDLCERIFGAIGTVVRIDESMMDAFTAVAGSGPAYLFHLAEAMVEGARRVGFGEEEAERIVRSTLVGAALLLDGSDRGAGELRRAVTSKGGTTEAALEVLTRAGAGRAMAEAIVAARDRGVALAGDGGGEPAGG